jgi:hypothetical protein
MSSSYSVIVNYSKAAQAIGTILERVYWVRKEDWKAVQIAMKCVPIPNMLATDNLTHNLALKHSTTALA